MIPAAATQFGSAPGSSVKHNGNAPRRLHGHPDFHDKLVGRFQSTPPAFALRSMNQGVRFVSYNRMDKKRRIYQPRVFDGRIIT
jgi:hypothetical protein